MDGKEKFEKKKNPRERANPLSALTFSWILRTFWVGYQRDLEVTDLYKPLKEHKSNILGEKIAAMWEAECQAINKKKEQAIKKGKSPDDGSKEAGPSLLKVLVKCFGARIMLYGVILVIMEITLRVLQPICLGRLLLL